MFLKKHLIFLLILILSISCKNRNADSENALTDDQKLSSNKNLYTDYPSYTPSGKVNVVVEIPSGTIAKYEYDKTDNSFKVEKIEGKDRLVQYLGYPGNYGFVPRTLLSEEKGGDGDPLDVIILGPAEKQGAIIECDIIGVLKMLDSHEQDDKLIALSANSPFNSIMSIDQLDEKYPGVTTIISTWFANYKGVGVVEVIGFKDEIIANEIIKEAVANYK